MRLVWVTCTTLGAGCSEFALLSAPDPTLEPGPAILVEPPELAFGALALGERARGELTLRNVGDATLHVSEVRLDRGLAFRLPGRWVPFELAPGEARTAEVEFSPTGQQENLGRVLVLSDDPARPAVPVSLVGLGQSPELQIRPRDYVFGDTFVPCGASVDLTLENVGQEDLVVERLDYTSGGQLSLDPARLPALPFTLAPGQTRGLTVSFAAATVGSDVGRLDVSSNDPRGVQSATQGGEGSYEQTFAEVFAEPGVPPVDVLMLIDNSCSMALDNMDDVRAGMPAFVDELELASDWQLLEVTLASGCGNGGVLGPATPDVEGVLVDNAFNTYQHPLTERLFQLADLALSQTGPGACNQGFLRPGATLHVVVVSDEPEQSGMGAEEWVPRLEAYVDSPDHLVISGVLDLSRSCGLGAGVYAAAVAETGGSAVDICTPAWGASFGAVAAEGVDGLRVYDLAHEPDPSSVAVEVGGVPTSAFTVLGRRVTVHDPPIGDGDVVEIRYGVLATCDAT